MITNVKTAIFKLKYGNFIFLNELSRKNLFYLDSE